MNILEKFVKKKCYLSLTLSIIPAVTRAESRILVDIQVKTIAGNYSLNLSNLSSISAVQCNIIILYETMNIRKVSLFLWFKYFTHLNMQVRAGGIDQVLQDPWSIWVFCPTDGDPTSKQEDRNPRWTLGIVRSDWWAQLGEILII